MALRTGRRAGGAGRPGVEDERGVRAEGGAGRPVLEEVVWAIVATGVRQPKGLCSPAAAPSAPTP